MTSKIKDSQKQIEPKKITCYLCGYIWYSRLERMPANCPRCKRYDYNKKREDDNARTSN